MVGCRAGEFASAFSRDLFVFAITQQFPGSQTQEKPVSTLQAEKVKIWTADVFAICIGKF